MSTSTLYRAHNCTHKCQGAFDACTNTAQHYELFINGREGYWCDDHKPVKDTSRITSGDELPF